MAEKNTEGQESRVPGGHDVLVEGGITYQGGHQLPRARAVCCDCDWEGPLRVSDPGDAHEDRRLHEEETDSEIDCPACAGTGRVSRQPVSTGRNAIDPQPERTD